MLVGFSVAEWCGKVQSTKGSAVPGQAGLDCVRKGANMSLGKTNKAVCRHGSCLDAHLNSALTSLSVKYKVK